MVAIAPVVFGKPDIAVEDEFIHSGDHVEVTLPGDAVGLEDGDFFHNPVSMVNACRFVMQILQNSFPLIFTVFGYALAQNEQRCYLARYHGHAFGLMLPELKAGIP